MLCCRKNVRKGEQEMKRYIRTKDNRFYEIETMYAKGNVIIKGLEPQETIAESDNVFDLIQLGDLVSYCWYDSDKLENEIYNNNLALHINDIIITKIYTKQNDNYCLVWDKERGVI